MMRTCYLKISNRHNKLGHLLKRWQGTAAAAPSIPEMPPCDFSPEPYSGISYEEALKVRKANLTPALLTYYKKPVMVYQGHKHWLWDTDGKRYLDMFGGIVTVGVGHCHPKINEAVKKQMDKLWHTTCIYLHPQVHEYVQKLTKKLPEHLNTVYFVNSGSEANDLALLMARLHTGSFDILSLRNAYHGCASSLLGLTAQGNWKFNTASGFGVHNPMNADVFRGPWGGARCKNSPVQTTRDCACAEGHCQACDNYLEQVEDLLRHSCSNNGIAGMFIEYIQGVGGTVQYPHGFMKKAFELVKKRGGVCIADEVQTGFGRTGDNFWGFQNDGAEPDIVTMAKTIGNGFPLAAVVTTQEIAQTLSTARTLHFNTYGGDALATTAGSAVLDVIEEENIQQNAGEVGTYFLKALEPLRDEFEIVGDVRGKGLMIGVEFVKDKKTNAPLPGPDVVSIWEAIKDNGVLVGKGGLYGSVLRVKPPMCVGKTEVDFAVAVMRKCIHDYTQANK